jgi:hypothetical protein
VGGLIAQGRALALNWRVAVAAGACAVIVAILTWWPRNSNVGASASALVAATGAPKAKTDPAPTIFNYQTTANHSIEALDDLLTRQGNKNPVSTPIYSASSRSAADSLD